MLLQKIQLLFLICLCFVFTSQLQGQNLKPIPKKHNKLINKRAILNEQRLAVSGGLGLASYYGDLCDKFDCMQFRPNLNIGAMLRMNRNLGVKAEINYFRLYSDDSYEYRNLNFRSNNFEVYVGGFAQYFPYERYEHKRKKINPYVYAGIGMVYYRPQGQLEGKWVNLRPLQTEGRSYSPVTAVIPMGGGLNIHLNKHYELQLEVGYRKTFSDYMDDVSSSTWTDPNTLPTRDAKLLSNKSTKYTYADWVKTQQPRGNPARDDGYFIGQVKVRYVFVSRKTNYRLRRAPLRKRF
jgi:hypothetical protein